MDHRTASGEVPESQPSGDLAEKIARDIWYASEEEDGPIALSKTFVVEMIPVIRESLSPIREALEGAEWGGTADVPPNSRYGSPRACPCCGGMDPDSKHPDAPLDLKGHHDSCRYAKALRLLRGEELSGNRGIVNEPEP